jgi:hypothetical protein
VRSIRVFTHPNFTTGSSGPAAGAVTTSLRVRAVVSHHRTAARREGAARAAEGSDAALECGCAVVRGGRWAYSSKTQTSFDQIVATAIAAMNCECAADQVPDLTNAFKCAALNPELPPMRDFGSLYFLNRHTSFVCCATLPVPRIKLS